MWVAMALLVGIIGLVLYGCLELFIVASFVVTAICGKSAGISSLASNVRWVFRVLVVVFLAVRVVWLSLHTFLGDSDWTFVLNRFAVMMFLTAFTLIIFYWCVPGVPFLPE